MDAVRREIRHAARRLVRTPAFTLAAALTLALAIGANASIFTVVDRVVLNPLPTGACFSNMVVAEGVTNENVPRPRAMFHAVAGGYFEATGIRLLRGRFIALGDVERGEPVAVVNKAMADALFSNQDPLGKRVKSSTPPISSPNAPPWLQVVGVVSNTPADALAEPAPMPQLYMPMSISGGPDIPAETLRGPSVSVMSYVVRASTPAADLVAAVRSAIGDVDSNLALFDVRSLEDILDHAAAQMAFTMILIVIAAGVALMLGVIGIYGVMSYIVSQRTGEIGVRLALGADPGRVAGMIVGQGGLVAIAGVVAGLALAWAGSRLIASLLYGVSPRDPGVFAATALLLLAVALVACWLPARRAARLSPASERPSRRMRMV